MDAVADDDADFCVQGPSDQDHLHQSTQTTMIPLVAVKETCSLFYKGLVMLFHVRQ